MTNLTLSQTYVTGLIVTIFIFYCYCIYTINLAFGTVMFPETNLTNLPSPTQDNSNLTDLSDLFLSEESSIANNSLAFNNSQISFSNNMELAGTEQIRIETNFSSKPSGLLTDYNIDDKPV